MCIGDAGVSELAICVMIENGLKLMREARFGTVPQMNISFIELLTTRRPRIAGENFDHWRN
jgi:hypothetical protein